MAWGERQADRKPAVCLCVCSRPWLTSRPPGSSSLTCCWFSRWEWSRAWIHSRVSWKACLWFIAFERGSGELCLLLAAILSHVEDQHLHEGCCLSPGSSIHTLASSCTCSSSQFSIPESLSDSHSAMPPRQWARIRFHPEELLSKTLPSAKCR